MTTKGGLDATSKAAISPPLKWHCSGGKHYLASRLVALAKLVKYIHFVEPYYGGGAVMLAMNPEGVSEVAGDIDGDLTNFWKVLKSPTMFPQFQRMAQATPFAEAVWEKSGVPQLTTASAVDSEGDWRAAMAYFIRCRQSMAGRMKDFAVISRRRVRRGMNEQASAWLTAVEGLPAVHARLQRVVILNRPALEVITSQDGPQTLFYCDPPYVHTTRASKADFKFEMTLEEHGQLLEVLGAIKGKFLLSGYDCDLYRDAEKRYGWSRKEFELPNNAAGGVVKRRMLEVVWANYDLEPVQPRLPGT